MCPLQPLRRQIAGTPNARTPKNYWRRDYLQLITPPNQFPLVRFLFANFFGMQILQFLELKCLSFAPSLFFPPHLEYLLIPPANVNVLALAFAGTPIAKKFTDQWYYGEVTRIEDPFYHVVYDDGDGKYLFCLSRLFSHFKLQ